MIITNLKALTFEEKVKLLTEKDQSYLQGYVDRALFAVKFKKTEQPHKPTIDRPA